MKHSRCSTAEIEFSPTLAEIHRGPCVGAIPFEFYAGNRALFSLLNELGQTDPEVGRVWAAARRAFYGRITYSLRRGIDLGLLRDDLDVVMAAELMGSMTEFYAFQRFALDDGVVHKLPTGQVAHQLAGIWASGLLRPSV